MISINEFNELSRKLSDAIPDSVKAMKSDIDSNLKAALESALQQMNLVSREEFDVQTALLERTQKKLEELEKQLEELEKKN